MRNFCVITIGLFWLLLTSLATASTVPNINPSQILANAPNLNRTALTDALKGYQWAEQHDNVTNPNVLTVIDFSLPSTTKRMWIIDLQTSKVLFNLQVAQGKASGLNYATYFSNQPGSDATSLGVYKTLNTYKGKHGLSLRLKGLEQGINNNAYKRDIVMHGAWYATPQFVKKYHHLGRSWGCFAIDPKVKPAVINAIKNGSVIFAYAAPEQHDPNLAAAA